MEVNEVCIAWIYEDVAHRQLRTAAKNDYEKLYPADEYGLEMGPEARVWQVYLDKSDVYDKELVDGWQETLNVLLTFVCILVIPAILYFDISRQAGLFSAVVTTFIVPAIQNLQPD